MRGCQSTVTQGSIIVTNNVSLYILVQKKLTGKLFCKYVQFQIYQFRF